MRTAEDGGGQVRMAGRDTMGKGLNLAIGLGLGAIASYLLDPDEGRRRRALIRDKGVKSWFEAQEMLRAAARDLEHRVQGLVVGLPHQFQEEPITDDVLVERVRSRLGRVCSHPHALRVQALEGVVTLEGPILEDEVAPVLSAVRSVRGVKEVVNQLEPHTRQEARNIPALQGGRHREPRMELLQDNWAPTTRLFAGMSGAGMFLAGLRRGGLPGALLQAAGALIVTRAAVNMPLVRAFGIAPSRRVVDVFKTININAPIDEVYEFWTHFTNFPLFMRHVRNVVDLGRGRVRWVLEGPGGIPVVFDTMVTHISPGEYIAWESIHGSEVQGEGFVRFIPNEDGSTRIDVRICYNPPLGMLGHFVAMLFGDDPKHALDEDLVRLKSLIEDGKTHAKGREVTLEEVLGPPIA